MDSELGIKDKNCTELNIMNEINNGGVITSIQI